MSIDERRRHALYERLEGVLEAEHADTLMELLPPVGWADVATKQDLAALEQRMDLRFEAMEHRFASVCVAPVWVARVATMLRGSGVLTCQPMPYSSSSAAEW